MILDLILPFIVCMTYIAATKMFFVAVQSTTIKPWYRYNLLCKLINYARYEYNLIQLISISTILDSDPLTWPNLKKKKWLCLFCHSILLEVIHFVIIFISISILLFLLMLIFYISLSCLSKRRNYCIHPIDLIICKLLPN